MLLPALYHWSPADRFAGINIDGLRLGCAPVVTSSVVHRLCLSPDPQQAWGLSGAMDWVSEIDEWDLWLVTLSATDEVSIRAEFGPQICEVQVRNNIARSQLWYVGRRRYSGGEGGPCDVTVPSTAEGVLVRG